MAIDQLDTDISEIVGPVNEYFAKRAEATTKFANEAWKRFENLLNKLKEFGATITVQELVQSGILTIFAIPVGSKDEVRTSTFARIDRVSSSKLKLTTQAGNQIGGASLEVERIETANVLGYVKFDTFSEVVIGGKIADTLSAGSLKESFIPEAQIFLQAMGSQPPSP